MSTECSNCGFEFDTSDIPHILDGEFKYECPQCGRGVIKGGDAEARRTRIKERKRINEKLESIAQSATETRVGTGYSASLEDLEQMVINVHTDIQTEIEKRSDE